MDVSRYESARERLLNRVQQLGVHKHHMDDEEEKGLGRASEAAPRLSERKGAGESPPVSPRRGAHPQGTRTLLTEHVETDEDGDMLIIRQSEHMQVQKQLLREAQHFGRVAVGHRIVDDDLEEFPRDPTNEGLYVPAPPEIPPWNLAKVEARLLREDLQRLVFFDSEGLMILMPEMTTSGSVAPMQFAEYEVRPELLATKVVHPARFTGKDDWFAFQVNIMDVTFTDHPFFTEEDYLCQKLSDAYDEYKRRQAVNLKKYYTSQITALMADYSRAKASYDKIPVTDKRKRGAKRALATRMVRALNQLQEARRLRDREEGELQLLFKHIYETWQKIRAWRAQTTKDFKLIGVLGEVGPLVDENERVGLTEAQIAALQAEREAKRNTEYIGFPMVLKVRKNRTDKQAELKQWKDDEAEELKEREILHNAQVFLDHADGTLDDVQAAIDSAAKFNSNDEFGRIRNRMKRLRRFPGRALYTPILEKRDRVSVVPAGMCSLGEQKRRQRIENTSLYVVLYVNGQVVQRTPKLGLAFPSFKATFNMTADLRVLTVPYTISADVYQAGVLSDTLIAQIPIPVPDYGSAASVQTIAFAGDRMKSELLPMFPDRVLSGKLSCSAHWVHKPGEHRANVWEAPQLFRGNVLTYGKKDRDAETMRQWKKLMRSRKPHAKLNVDPNDPRNRALVEMQRREARDGAAGRPFRPEEFRAELELINDKYHVPSARRVVLSARNRSPLIKEPVPLDDAEIGQHLYEMVLLEDRLGAHKMGTAGMDLIQLLQSSGGSKSLLPVRTGADGKPLEPGKVWSQREEEALSAEERSMRAQWKEKSKILSARRDIYHVEEVVKEGPKPELAVNFEFLDKLFRPRRKLHVYRKKLKPVSNPKACNLVVQIINGQNLPVRQTDRLQQSKKKSGRTNAQERENVRCFVEVTFQDMFQRTRVSRGTNASWNQLITLPFSPPAGSFAPAQLLQCKDEVHFNIFDEVVSVERVEDYRLKNTKVEKTERRFIGRFSIPFTTIYRQNNVDRSVFNGVEGAFEVEVPLLHLGYERPSPNHPTLLHVFATLDPPLSIPPVPSFKHRRSMNKALVYALEWIEQVKAYKQCKDRYIKTLAGDINNVPSLICRYVHPQAPPIELQGNPAMFLRFVSCLPFMEDGSIGSHQAEVWCTSSQFLTLMAGDWEEHALLLANYFKWHEETGRGNGGLAGGMLDGGGGGGTGGIPEELMGTGAAAAAGAQGAQNGMVANAQAQAIRDGGALLRSNGWTTFLVLGIGIPEGKTCYVLRIRRKDGLTTREIMYNAVTGREYDLDKDADVIPLQSIGCVFNEHNIWANIQEADSPVDLNFNFDNSKLWKPFFHEGFSIADFEALLNRPLLTVQKPLYDFYVPTGDTYAIERGRQIERMLERRFEKWRIISTTWNKGVCHILRKFLEYFEPIQHRSSVELDNDAVLGPLRSSFSEVYGFPLNFKEAGDPIYLDDTLANPIVKGLYETRIHENEHPDAVFALAVHCHPYVNQVLSVWVYAAVLLNR